MADKHYLKVIVFKNNLTEAGELYISFKQQKTFKSLMKQL